jgi:hypothetical protein
VLALLPNIGPLTAGNFEGNLVRSGEKGKGGTEL